jgi:hypothetical protein
MKLINLTPHSITIGNVVLPAPEKGKEVRVAVERQQVGEVGGVKLFQAKKGKLENFRYPLFQEEILIVSGIAKAEILRQYPEFEGQIASPGQLLRDAAGVVIGADGLDL